MEYIYPSLKLGFDLHGVIDADPERFKLILVELIKQRHSIFVISGPPSVDIILKLNRLGIKTEPFFSNDGSVLVEFKVLSIVDFLKSKNIKMNQDEKGNWWTDQMNWWSSKAHICEENDIDYHFDDTFTYAQFFHGIKTKFVHVNNKQ